jgi:hypothetical protein
MGPEEGFMEVTHLSKSSAIFPSAAAPKKIATPSAPS